MQKYFDQELSNIFCLYAVAISQTVSSPTNPLCLPSDLLKKYQYQDYLFNTTKYSERGQSKNWQKSTPLKIHLPKVTFSNCKLKIH